MTKTSTLNNILKLDSFSHLSYDKKQNLLIGLALIKGSEGITIDDEHIKPVNSQASHLELLLDHDVS